MKINNYNPGKSSFLSVEKDLEILINTFLSNYCLIRLAIDLNHINMK